MELTFNKTPSNIKHFIRIRQYLLISIAGAGASIILFFVFIFPRLQLIPQLRKTLSREVELRENLNKKASALKTIQTNPLYEKKDIIHGILPSSKPLLPLLYQFEQIATETEVAVIEFTVSPGELASESSELAPDKQVQKKKSKKIPQKDVEAIEFQLVVTGRLLDINEFLTQIDTLVPVTDMFSISLQPSRRKMTDEIGEVGEKMFEAELLLRSYFLSNMPSLPKISQPLTKLNASSQETLANLENLFRLGTSQEQGREVMGGKENLFE